MIGVEELKDAFIGMGNVPRTEVLLDLVREAWVRKQYARAEAYCLLDEDLEDLHDTIYTARGLRFMCIMLHEELGKAMERDDASEAERIFVQIKFYRLWRMDVDNRVDNILDTGEVGE